MKFTSFNDFKSRVIYNDRFKNIFSGMVILLVMAVAYNLISTVITIVKNGLLGKPQYWIRIFLSIEGESGTSPIWAIIVYGTYILVPVCIIFAIIYLVMRNGNLRKLYDAYQSNGVHPYVKVTDYAFRAGNITNTLYVYGGNEAEVASAVEVINNKIIGFSKQDFKQLQKYVSKSSVLNLVKLQPMFPEVSLSVYAFVSPNPPQAESIICRIDNQDRLYFLKPVK
ncbi:hypothetical protein [Culicoidibacter larvae]|uniref:Uncharacterized protein n=1 Tax=Culicoidibacter larvae TaxID=2579976 RepID=A0A5R8QCN9_9FIRM|nr:hypothetical protein [Culicoidibacter larvae]TLG74295.1 hypothetical protein FEZ08_06200 [Culicoidibacter larvae]